MAPKSAPSSIKIAPKPTNPPTTAPPTHPTRYSKRKRNEPPSSPPVVDTSIHPAKKPRPAPINTSGKRLPGSKRLPEKPVAKALPKGLEPRIDPPAPIYPSPWADIATSIWDISKTDAASEGVKAAYAVLKAVGRVEFEWEHEAGLTVWFRGVNGDMTTGVDQGLLYTKPIVGMTWVAGYGQVCWRDQITLAKRVKAGKANALRMRSVMEVFREGDGEEAKFFVLWEDMRDVKINGRVCLPEDEGMTGYVAGPLPEFAVIEVEDAVVFWFRDAKAMDFTTQEIVEAKLNKELLGEIDEDFEEIGEGDADGDDNDEDDEGNEEERKEKCREWKRIWQEGMNTHTLECNCNVHDLSPTFVKKSSNLRGEEIVVAIASVWATADQSLRRRFAIHEYNFYDIVRGLLLDAKGFRYQIPAAVYGPNDLLIPLLFDDEYVSPPNSAKQQQQQTPSNIDEQLQTRNTDEQSEENKNKQVGRAGHILFAVAQKKESNTVNAKIMDSLPGFITKERSMAAIKKTVERIGWLGMDKAGQAIELDYDIDLIEESIVDVPIQEGVNTCGIYAILNAWMVLLGLPALNKRQRDLHNESMSSSEFVSGALKMINLAMAGHMDLETIQAFFNCSGYCTLQDPKDAQIRLLSDDLTEKMNDRRFHELLEGARATGQATTQYEVIDRQFPQAIVDLVKQRTGCRHSEAIRLLDLTDGDADNAVSLFLVENSTDNGDKDD